MTPSDKNFYRVVRFLEFMWIVIGGLCVVMAVYKYFTIGIEDALFFLSGAGISTILYFLRRRVRKNFERQQENSNN